MTAGRLVLAALAAAVVFASGCDPEPGSSHRQNVQVDDSVCKAQLTHGHRLNLPAPEFFARTARGAGCLGGVAAQLQFRATDGQIQTTPWVWDTTEAVVTISTNDAAASAISSHVVCANSGNCQQFIN
jgi:hypothetical protein